FPFFSNASPTTDSYPLSLHDALPISHVALPASGSVVQSFQDNGQGIMIAPKEKIDVSAMEEGVVIFAGNDKDTDQTVVIQHTNGSQTTYGHLESKEVHLYQFIESNQVIGQFTPSAEYKWV